MLENMFQFSDIWLYMPCNVNEVLKDKTALSDLRALQEKYVIVPVDKATGNLAYL